MAGRPSCMGSPAIFVSALLLLLAGSCAQVTAEDAVGTTETEPAASSPAYAEEPAVEGRELRVIALKHVTTWDAVKVVQMHFDLPPRMHADERRNALLVSAEPEKMQQVLDVIALIDVPFDDEQ